MKEKENQQDNTTNSGYQSMWTELAGFPFSQDWLKAGDVNTRYIHTGSDSMPNLIMLHGFIGHAEAFISNLASHGEYFNTYAIDMIGSGYTDKPDYDYHIPRVAKHVRDFMDAAGMEKASIMGTSYGSRVAARFAVEYPDRLEKLTLISPAGLRFFPEASARLVEGHDAIDNPSWEGTKAVVNRLFGSRRVTDDMIACRQKIFQQPEMKEAKKHLAVVHLPDTGELSLISADEFKSIKAPTLLIKGILDRQNANIEGAKEIADLIPNSRFVIMEGCDHGPYFEDPDTFNKIHLDFLLDRN
ncbi:MAG: alpha/beta hydrolase [Deltaproteobacteria bacterium]|nr:alpha/beta hydrolase [Deltaproteobacteria bacterium]